MVEARISAFLRKGKFATRDLPQPVTFAVLRSHVGRFLPGARELFVDTVGAHALECTCREETLIIVVAHDYAKMGGQDPEALCREWIREFRQHRENVS